MALLLGYTEESCHGFRWLCGWNLWQAVRGDIFSPESGISHKARVFCVYLIRRKFQSTVEENGMAITQKFFGEWVWLSQEHFTSATHRSFLDSVVSASDCSAHLYLGLPGSVDLQGRLSNLRTADIWGWLILCCGRLSCVP